MYISKDTLLMLFLLFAASVGGNIYQRLQYGDLLAAHIDLQWQHTASELGCALTEAERKRCEARCPRERVEPAQP